MEAIKVVDLTKKYRVKVKEKGPKGSIMSVFHQNTRKLRL